MDIQTFAIAGPALLTPAKFVDERGFFTERFRADTWSKFKPGHPGFIQDNYSFSAANVLRGLHFQFAPDQGKLVTCTTGAILDVIVDIRPRSPTFGQHLKVELRAETPRWFWVPPGFAHGFCVLGAAGAGVLYKVDQPYARSGEGAIAWNDGELGIEWPLPSPILSAKDASAPSFRSYREGAPARAAQDL